MGEASASFPADHTTKIDAAIAAKRGRILLGIKVPHRATYGR
jgi:hypothetical protein